MVDNPSHSGHPLSGSFFPVESRWHNQMVSQPDIQLCKELKEAAKLVQIQLLDNLIITQNSYVSFQDEGIF